MACVICVMGQRLPNHELGQHHFLLFDFGDPRPLMRHCAILGGIGFPTINHWLNNCFLGELFIGFFARPCR